LIDGLADKFVIVSVRSDPKPDKTIFSFDGDSAIPEADAGGPEIANLLEV